ncbi:MAG: acyltransferase family protein [Flavobacteriales bacterium]
MSGTKTSKPARELRSPDTVRGIAALGVVLFHYGGVVLPSLAPHPLQRVLAYGEYGVEVFFVLSGFVIPYSMWRSGYGPSGLGPFMLKRYLRIAPLAYLSALLMIAYHGLAMAILGRPVNAPDWPGTNAASVIGNLIFLPQLFGTSWFNFAFWTLAVEFGFYLSIALLLPVLMHPSMRRLSGFIAIALLGLSIWSDTDFLRFTGYFALGVSAFLFRRGVMGHAGLALIAAASMAALLVQHPWPPVLLSAVTTALILWRPGIGSRFTDWLGAISYSLYVMHVPVGYFSESALKRIVHLHESAWGKVAMLAVYTCIALLVAHVVYQVAEKPLLERLKRIRYASATGSQDAPRAPRTMHSSA